MPEPRKEVPSLLPCPFCGSSKVEDDNEDAGRSSFIRCNQCLARSRYGDYAEAIAAWNRRAPTVEVFPWQNPPDLPATKTLRYSFACLAGECQGKVKGTREVDGASPWVAIDCECDTCGSLYTVKSEENTYGPPSTGDREE